jgi:hypothetical protein
MKYAKPTRYEKLNRQIRGFSRCPTALLDRRAAVCRGDAGDAELSVLEPSPAIVVEVGNKVRMTIFASAPVALVAATLKALR